MRLYRRKYCRWKGTLVANVCKVTITKIEDFDEVMPIIQVRVGKFGGCVIGWKIWCEHNLKEF